MIRINPNKILCGGDTKRAKNFIGPANSQMEILKQEMSFQKLKQGVRRVWLADGVYVECVKIFNYQACKIWVEPMPLEVLAEIIVENILTVVVSSENGDEAVAWDITNDTMLFGKNTFTEISTLLADSDFSPLVQLQHSSTFEENTPGWGLVDQPGNIPDAIMGFVWILSGGSNINTIGPYNEDVNDWNFDAMLDLVNGSGSVSTEFMGLYFKILPNAFYSTSSEWEIGDYITFSTTRASAEITNIYKHSSGGFDNSKIIGDVLGSITETWTVKMVEGSSGVGLHIHVSGASVGGVYDSGTEVLVQRAFEDNNIGLSYIPWDVTLSSFKSIELPEYDIHPSAYSFKKDDSFRKESWETEFQTISGYSWPTGMGSITREAIFYNPLFGPDFTDLIPYSAQMKASVTNLYDSFIDGDWSEPAWSEDSDGTVVQDRPDLACNRANICSTLGVGESYMPIDSEDTTQVLAWVVFDAFWFNSYAGGSVPIKAGINIQYRLKEILSGSEKDLFDLINIERTTRGLGALIQNHILQTAAIRQAKDMAVNAMNEHIGSDGSTYYSRAEDAGYCINRPKPYCLVGENIGMATLDTFELSDWVQAWMDSPGHRENILFEDFTETGVSIAFGDNDFVYFCQVFGGKPGAWGGFGAFDTTNLEKYINDNFTFSADMTDNFLKVYATQKIDSKNKDLS